MSSNENIWKKIENGEAHIVDAGVTKVYSSAPDVLNIDYTIQICEPLKDFELNYTIKSNDETL